MPISRKILKSAVNTIIDSEVLDRIRFKLTQKDSDVSFVSKKANLITEYEKMPYLKGEKHVDDPSVYSGNIESYIGTAQIPVGVIGPMKINGAYANGEFMVPLATTEGALVASYNRGAKVISKSGGATAMCILDSISRAPGFIFNNMIEATRFVAWCSEHFDAFKAITQEQTRFGRLQDMQSSVDGNMVSLIFQFTTKDAAGQNMVTFATDAICRFIIENSPITARQWFIEGNLSGDKKATFLSFQGNRGKKVLAEVAIKRNLVKRILHTTPEKMVEYSQFATLQGLQTGSIGVQGHYANGLAALFIACGQDAACVAEAAIGITKAQVTEKGDLYVSVNLPSLPVGTVGGGTGLPTQNECLRIMGCNGADNARKFAEIAAVTVLAGEISIAAAITAGHFAKAHEHLARYKKIKMEKMEKNNEQHLIHA